MSMSSFAGALLFRQQIRFCQAASAAALLYDYLLAFASEVDLIWARKWNLITLLYAIVRYLSFFLILDNMLYTGNVNWGRDVSLVWYQIREWGPYVFRVAMDIIMMKRILALSRTSSGFLSSPKFVLIIMVPTFIARYAASIALLLLAIGPGSHLTSMDSNVAGAYMCGDEIPQERFLIYAQFPTLGFEILLFALALGYLIADVIEFWRSKEPKTWKVNDLLRILVRDSTVYFAINAGATALDVGNFESSGSTLYMAVSMALQAFLPYCFAPRLVINVRKHENRVHMSGFGEELCDMQLDEDLAHFPQGIQQAEDLA